MFGSENVKVATLTIEADPGGSDEIFYLMKAQRALTVKSVNVVSEQGQGAGTATQLRIECWGTAGTAVAGTICAYVGGTAVADRLSARTPATGALDSTQVALDEGEWLVVRYGELGAGWVSGDRLHVTVGYVDGV